MTVARPFTAVRYDAAKVDLSKVIVPPYDVIAADERETYFDRDPHNAIRFELTREVADEAEADYAVVGETLAAWRESGVLIKDSEPFYYVMRQRFTAPSGEVLERIGFFAELGLADYSERAVLPHERTLAGPKADRLKVLRASRANLSSVFLLYQDRQQELDAILARALAENPLGDARDDAGVEYTLARIENAADIESIQRFVSSRSVVIADGHHRYETALAYRDEQRGFATSPDPAAPYESTLAYFANAYAPGSLLLPIHRVVKKEACPAPPTDAEWAAALPGWSEKAIPLTDTEKISTLLGEYLEPLADRPSFAADDAKGNLRVFWRDEPLGDELMVRILEDVVLKSVFGLDTDAIREGAVSFPKSSERAAREVREGEGAVALYLNPMTPDDVFRVTGKGEVMPQKSTFFYPKVPTGLIFRDHKQ
jgi:uncharacterized protein (DUF1015 family)